MFRFFTPAGICTFLVFGFHTDILSVHAYSLSFLSCVKHLLAANDFRNPLAEYFPDDVTRHRRPRTYAGLNRSKAAHREVCCSAFRDLVAMSGLAAQQGLRRAKGNLRHSILRTFWLTSQAEDRAIDRLNRTSSRRTRRAPTSLSPSMSSPISDLSSQVPIEMHRAQRVFAERHLGKPARRLHPYLHRSRFQ